MAEGSFDERSCAAYHHRWKEAFGWDFAASAAFAWFLSLPGPLGCLALDAVAVVGTRQGQAFLDEFGELMTGVRSKAGFLRPGLAVPITVEMCRQLVLRVF